MLILNNPYGFLIQNQNMS